MNDFVLDAVVKIVLICSVLTFTYVIVSDMLRIKKNAELKKKLKESDEQKKSLLNDLNLAQYERNRLFIKNGIYINQWQADSDEIKLMKRQIGIADEKIKAANELIASLKLRNADLLKHNSNFDKFDGLVNNIENTKFKKSDDYYAIRNISEDAANLQVATAIEGFKAHAKLFGKRCYSAMRQSVSNLAAKKLRDKGFEVNYNSDGFVYISIKEDA